MAKTRETAREAAARIRGLADHADIEQNERALRRFAAELDGRADRDEAAISIRARLRGMMGRTASAA